MISVTLRLAKGVAIVAAFSAIAGCALPRVGPNKAEIFSGSVLEQGDAFVLTVDDRVNRIAAVTPALGFSKSFRDQSILGASTISPGDILSLTIWENTESGVLVPSGQNATILEEVQVDSSGFIFVPYAGQIRAAGNSPEAIRRIISDKLGQMTPDPQVQVRRLAGDGSSVSIVGAVGGQGVFQIERPTRTLSAMLASAGGVSTRPEIARVTLVRGNKSGSIWFEDLYNHPGHDIALRSGDRIIVEEDTRAFTALGATGSQSRVQFESQMLSALEAIAQVGGLSSNLADPTGVFILRNEPEEIAKQLLGRDDITGSQRVIYLLDLTQPNGMFMARDFAIRDGDTLYVTEAPYVQFNKTIAAATGTLGAATSLSTAATGL